LHFPPVRQRPRCQNIDFNAEKTGEFCANRTNIKERCFFGGIDDDIQITFLRVQAMKDRAEDAWISGMMPLDNPLNVFTVSLVCNRWFHAADPDCLVKI